MSAMMLVSVDALSADDDASDPESAVPVLTYNAGYSGRSLDAGVQAGMKASGSGSAAAMGAAAEAEKKR